MSSKVIDSNSSEPKNEGFDRQVGFIEVVWFVLAAAFVFLILAYWYSFSKYGWSTNPDAWGQFGDFLGGILNPLVSLAALFALVISVRMQRTELKDTRAELIEARKVATEQSKTADQQRREQRFFDLLNLYQRTVDSLSLLYVPTEAKTPFELRGKSAMDQWLRSSERTRAFGLFENKGFHNIPKQINNSTGMTVTFESSLTFEQLKTAWDSAEVAKFIDPYFRIVFRILSEAELLLGEDHYRYVKLLRAQLNRNELMLLTYNMWLDNEGGKMRPLAAKYGLLKHLPAGKLKEEVERIFPQRVFGKKKGVGMNTVLKDLEHLSTREKIQLVHDLWDDIYEKSRLQTKTISVRTEPVEVFTSPSTSSGRTD